MNDTLILPETVQHDAELTRQLFEAHLAVRSALVLYGIVFGCIGVASGDHPAATIVIVAVIALWTAFTGWWYLGQRSRLPMVVIDCLFTVGGLILLAELAPLLTPNFVSVPVAWAVSAPLAAAICSGPVAGFTTGLAVGLASVVAQPLLSASTWSAPFGIVLASTGLGFLVEKVRKSLAERDRIAASATVLAERQRLARVIHDGALQVLALVERDAGALGPRGAALAKEAREQEQALRTLLLDKDLPWDDPGFMTTRDLTTLLDRHACEGVTVSAMADKIMMDNESATEVDAAVTEVLTNVTKHAGADAKAWILLEQVGPEIIISIRDNGTGADLETFKSARENGRLGIKQSIVGRISDLGGVAKVRATPGRGVEWEFRVPVSR